AVIGLAFTTYLLSAQDLSKYRGFHLTSTLPVVAKQLQMKATDAKTIHKRPATIQELEWQSPYLDPKQPADSVRNVLFRFYNGELFRMVVSYDRERTEGLTVADLIEALSVKYGDATRPVGDVTLSSTG
ncbi:MAG: hypothetical protein ABI882_23205, partial [Acidobacteriota bacterium]